MEILKDYLLHISFILFPIFLYQAIWLNKPIITAPKANSKLVTALAAVSSCLCIMYPIQEMEHHVHFGLQTIPIIICFIYISIVSGLIVAASAFCFQLMFFDSSAFAFLLALPFIIILPILLQKKWPFMSKTKKLLFGFFIGCWEIILLFISIFTFSVQNISNFQNFGTFVLDGAVAGLFSICVLMISIYTIESIAETVILRSQLIQSEKMTIVSELAASVAHEVRNPLTVVRGFVQLLFNDESLQNKSSADYKKLVLSELDRAQDIITNYLDMAKPQYYEKEVFDLSALLKETGSLMVSYANFKSVAIQVETEPGLSVYGDVTKLKQAMINLIKNSIEAVTPGNGLIRVSAKRHNHMIHIYITDNGIGMTDHQMKKLGEPYYTLKTNGTGLGLTVTFSIIKHHQGTISFNSSFHSGTTAVIKLPADLPY